MQTVTINISGCDDETSFTATTDHIGLNVLRKIQRQSHHDGGGCKPVLTVYDGDLIDREIGGLDYQKERVALWPEDIEDTHD